MRDTKVKLTLNQLPRACHTVRRVATLILVYNNFVWPQNATNMQRGSVEEKAQAVLDARQQFPAATLADLYDPPAMPPALVKAHAELDRAVDLCYRREPFESERQRVEYLFALYEGLTAPLLPVTNSKRARRGKT